MKPCVDCKKVFGQDEFQSIVKGKIYKRRRCKQCMYVAHRKWWKKTRNAKPDYFKALHKKTMDKLKNQLDEHYGTSCKCCGKTKRLTLDHVNNDGPDHRKAINARGGDKVFADIRKNNFPDTYQRLCYSCNTVKSKIARDPKRYLSEGSIQAFGSYWGLVNIHGDIQIKPTPSLKDVEYRKRQLEFFKNNPKNLGKLILDNR